MWASIKDAQEFRTHAKVGLREAEGGRVPPIAFASTAVQGQGATPVVGLRWLQWEWAHLPVIVTFRAEARPLAGAFWRPVLPWPSNHPFYYLRPDSDSPPRPRLSSPTRQPHSFTFQTISSRVTSSSPSQGQVPAAHHPCLLSRCTPQSGETSLGWEGHHLSGFTDKESEASRDRALG